MGIIGLGDIKKIEKGVNKGSGPSVVLLQVQLSESDDVQTVMLMNPPGEDNMPTVGGRVLVLDVGAALKVAVASNDGQEPSMLEGEKMIYSIEAGVVKGFIKIFKTGNITIEGAKVTLTASGDLELNGNVDYAVKFNALKAAYDAHIIEYNAHVHGGVAVGSGSTGITTVPSLSNIDAAKVDTVRLP